MSKDTHERRGEPYLEARYTNYVEIGQNGAELIVDCGQHYGEEEPRFHTRLIMVPLHAYDLLDLLRRSLDDYERSRGPTEPIRSDGA